jgi:hypothetical protein
VNEPSGRLLVCDLDRKEVVKSCEILEAPYREMDPNPRGGFRGLKGISIYEDRIAIANSSTVFIYDFKWRPLNYFWHPTCAGIHDIELRNDTVWVTSSRNDLLVSMDFNGNIVNFYDLRKFITFDQPASIKIKPFLREAEIISGKINFRDPSTHDSAVTDLLHVNSLAFQNNGDILVSCGLLRIVDQFYLHKINDLLKRSILSKSLPALRIFTDRLRNTKKVINFEHTSITKEKSLSKIMSFTSSGEWSNRLVIKECAVPSHSVRVLGDLSAIYLDSTSGRLFQFNPNSGQIISTHKLGHDFLRGAKVLHDGSVLLGDNNYIIHFDLSKNQILSRIKITENPAEAVFDINVMPDYFTLPPQSFIELHNQKHPVVQQ